jgi:hypothetical protein
MILWFVCVGFMDHHIDLVLMCCIIFLVEMSHDVLHETSPSTFNIMMNPNFD